MHQVQPWRKDQAMTAQQKARKWIFVIRISGTRRSCQFYAVFSERQRARSAAWRWSFGRPSATMLNWKRNWHHSPKYWKLKQRNFLKPLKPITGLWAARLYCSLVVSCLVSVCTGLNHDSCLAPFNSKNIKASLCHDISVQTYYPALRYRLETKSCLVLTGIHANRQCANQ